MLFITISGKAYEKAEEIGTSRSCSGRPGRNATPHDPHRADRMGVLGEAAVARSLKLKVDSTYRPQGDNGIDFILPPQITVDVKTSDYHTCWVKEKKRDPYSHLYIFVTLISENRVEKTATLQIEGYIELKDILKRPLVKSPHGHWNYEMKPSELKPFEELVEKYMPSEEVIWMPNRSIVKGVN